MHLKTQQNIFVPGLKQFTLVILPVKKKNKKPICIEIEKCFLAKEERKIAFLM